MPVGKFNVSVSADDDGIVSLTIKANRDGLLAFRERLDEALRDGVAHMPKHDDKGELLIVKLPDS